MPALTCEAKHDLKAGMKYHRLVFQGSPAEIAELWRAMGSPGRDWFSEQLENLEIAEEDGSFRRPSSTPTMPEMRKVS